MAMPATRLEDDEIMPENVTAATQRHVLRELKRLSDTVLEMVRHGVPSDLERWRGGVDEQLRHIAVDVSELKESFPKDMERLGQKVTNALKDSDACGRKEHNNFDARIKVLENEKSRISVVIALLAGLGGIIGGGLSSAAFSNILTRAWGN